MNENELRLIRMADVELQKVDWLWFPFIPFGKISMIQGDPGEGKTTLALRLAAACSRGFSLPNLKVEKYILKRSRYSNADFFEIQGIAGGNFGIPSAVVEFC